MELTKEQRDFFADLDLDKALEAGEGKVHFDFTRKDHIIAVEAYCACDADIIVRHMDEAGVVSAPDKRLSLFNIPGTTNVSAEKVLRMVYEASVSPVNSKLKQAWLDTPYVKRWYVHVQGTFTEFLYRNREDQYTIEVSEDPADDGATVAELFMSGAKIHTFTIPQPYYKGQTAQRLLKLAESINEAWRDAVLDSQYGEQSK